MSRYLLSEDDMPIATDYYYEATHTRNPHFSLFKSHSHNYYEIYLFLYGVVQLSVEDNVFNVEKGDS